MAKQTDQVTLDNAKRLKEIEEQLNRLITKNDDQITNQIIETIIDDLAKLNLEINEELQKKWKTAIIEILSRPPSKN